MVSEDTIRALQNRPRSGTVVGLKYFLAENGLPTTGKKAELQERVANLVEIEDLELAIDAKAYVDLTIADAPTFRDSPVTGWSLGDPLYSSGHRS